jgi:hypothetical protein
MGTPKRRLQRFDHLWVPGLPRPIERRDSRIVCCRGVSSMVKQQADHGHLSVVNRTMQRGPTPSLTGIDLRSMTDQELCDFQMLRCDRGVERRDGHGVAGRSIRVCPVGEQERDGVQVPKKSRQAERGEPVRC